MENKKDFAEETLGVKKPRSFILDSSVLQNQEEFDDLKEEIKQHRIIFEFPGGLNDIDILSRCRMLTATDNFDLCYETVLEMLEGKPVSVSLKNYDNVTTHHFASFQIVNKEMDLRAVPAINEYPIIINWLVEFIVGLELKKFPLPLRTSSENQSEAESKNQKKKKNR